MKFSTAISTGMALLPALSGVTANILPRQNDPQKSLTLDPKVIASSFANDGQDVPAAGQVASLTSTNNFINYCLTVNLPITNGKQVQTGSCNPTPIGAIPSTEKMPSSKFTNPKNGDIIRAGTAFTITMAVKNLATGNFVNAQTNYFAAPQQLNSQGIIIGHSHVVVDILTSLSQTTPTNPKQFAFFKGLNGVAQNGVLSTSVDNGLPVGFYRLCSINAAANHQPAIAPIAQHGSLDDCVYFTVTANGAAVTASLRGTSTTAAVKTTSTGKTSTTAASAVKTTLTSKAPSTSKVAVKTTSTGKTTSTKAASAVKTTSTSKTTITKAASAAKTTSTSKTTSTKSATTTKATSTSKTTSKATASIKTTAASLRPTSTSKTTIAAIKTTSTKAASLKATSTVAGLKTSTKAATATKSPQKPNFHHAKGRNFRGPNRHRSRQG